VRRRRSFLFCRPSSPVSPPVLSIIASHLALLSRDDARDSDPSSFNSTEMTDALSFLTYSLLIDFPVTADVSTSVDSFLFFSSPIPMRALSSLSGVRKRLSFLPRSPS